MRPQSISILCIVLALVGASFAVRALGQFAMQPGFYNFFMIVTSLLGLYCYYGLWNMKRWCVPLFFVVWAAISIPTLMRIDSYSMVMTLRAVYLVLMLILFIVVVIPHTDKLSEGSIFDFKRSGD